MSDEDNVFRLERQGNEYRLQIAELEKRLLFDTSSLELHTMSTYKQLHCFRKHSLVIFAGSRIVTGRQARLNVAFDFFDLDESGVMQPLRPS